MKRKNVKDENLRILPDKNEVCECLEQLYEGLLDVMKEMRDVIAARPGTIVRFFEKIYSERLKRWGGESFEETESRKSS